MILLVLDGMAVPFLVLSVAGAALSMSSSVSGLSMRAIVGSIGAVLVSIVRAIVGSLGAAKGSMMRAVMELMVVTGPIVIALWA